jgi:hypothetical protein
MSYSELVLPFFGFKPVRDHFGSSIAAKDAVKATRYIFINIIVSYNLYTVETLLLI